MLQSGNSPLFPSQLITVPFERNGLSEVYAYEGRLGRFRPHEIEGYQDGG